MVKVVSQEPAQARGPAGRGEHVLLRAGVQEGRAGRRQDQPEGGGRDHLRPHQARPGEDEGVQPEEEPPLLPGHHAQGVGPGGTGGLLPGLRVAHPGQGLRTHGHQRFGDRPMPLPIWWGALYGHASVGDGGLPPSGGASIPGPVAAANTVVSSLEGFGHDLVNSVPGLATAVTQQTNPVPVLLRRRALGRRLRLCLRLRRVRLRLRGRGKMMESTSQRPRVSRELPCACERTDEHSKIGSRERNRSAPGSTRARWMWKAHASRSPSGQPRRRRGPHPRREPHPPRQRHRGGDGQAPPGRALRGGGPRGHAQALPGVTRRAAPRGHPPHLHAGQDPLGHRPGMSPHRPGGRPHRALLPGPHRAAADGPGPHLPLPEPVRPLLQRAGARRAGAGHGRLAEDPRRVLRGGHPPRGLHGRRAHPARGPPRPRGLRRGAGPGDGPQHQRPPAGGRRLHQAPPRGGPGPRPDHARVGRTRPSTTS